MPAISTTRYVAVYEGEGPGTSRPLIATSDPTTVAAITRIIVDRVNSGLPLHPRLLNGADTRDDGSAE